MSFYSRTDNPGKLGKFNRKRVKVYPQQGYEEEMKRSIGRQIKKILATP